MLAASIARRCNATSAKLDTSNERTSFPGIPHAALTSLTRDPQPIGDELLRWSTSSGGNQWW